MPYLNQVQVKNGILYLNVSSTNIPDWQRQGPVSGIVTRSASTVTSSRPTTISQMRHMTLVVAATDDYVLDSMHCPACKDPFLGGMRVFLSADERTAIHATCVTALALVAALKGESEAEVDLEAAAKTEELLRVLTD